MNATHEPVLSADFAERVLARADVVIAGRRRVRHIVGGIAALGFVSIAVVSWSMMSGMTPSPAMRGGSQNIALAGAQDQAQTDEPDALSDLFPDAASVASFASEYDTSDDADTSILPDEDPTSS
jgi:hypothetical protein